MLYSNNLLGLEPGHHSPAHVHDMVGQPILFGAGHFGTAHPRIVAYGKGCIVFSGVCL